MDCKLVQETLSSYVAGEATAIEQRVISEHLKACGECRELAKELEASWNLLDAWTSPPPPALAPYRFHKNLKEMIRQQQEKETVPTFEKVLRRYSFWVRGWQAVSVPAFATLVTLAFFWGIDWDARSSFDSIEWGKRAPTYVSSTAGAGSATDKSSGDSTQVKEVTASAAGVPEEVNQPFTVVNYETPSGVAAKTRRLPASHNFDYY